MWKVNKATEANLSNDNTAPLQPVKGPVGWLVYLGKD